MSPVDQLKKYYGSASGHQNLIPLQAGSLTLMYDRGFLRYLRAGELEIVRMIYFALRDPDWGTVQGAIQNEKIEIKGSSFQISYQSVHHKKNIHYTFDVTIEGKTNSTLTFEIRGRALSEFKRNRIGLCVLHPVSSCAGKPVKVRQPDGNSYEGEFPVQVSPHQPFLNIREMAWTIKNGRPAELKFEGDVFETEDQRNWTDSTYKTYGTPLSLPFPVTVRPGDEVNQKVELLVKTDRMPVRLPEKEIKIFFDQNIRQPLPGLGIMNPGDFPLTDQDIHLLKKLNPDGIRCDLNLSSGSIRQPLDRIREISVQTGLKVFLALKGDRVEDFTGQLDLLAGRELPLSDILILQSGVKCTREEFFRDIFPPMKKTFKGVRIGSGTDYNFAELNRNRPIPPSADFYSFSINPQVHATDHLTLIENIEAQGEVIRNARQFIPGAGIYVSPVTLKPRIQPAATDSFDRMIQDKPEWADERQVSLLGAAWTLGSMASLANAGANHVTYFEVMGWNGIFPGEKFSGYSTGLESNFPRVYPLYFVLYWFGRLKKADLVPSRTSQPLKAGSLMLQNKDQTCLMVSSFSEERILINLEEIPDPVLLQQLNEITVGEFIKDPDAFLGVFGKREIKGKLELLPFETALIRTGG